MTHPTLWLLALAFLMSGPLACAGSVPAAPQIAERPGGASAASDGHAVTVFYPAGDCPTGVIEVQLWDRTQEAWVAHPDHPQVQAGSCQVEQSDQLLNEFRVRCIDPAGERSPSPWVEGAMTSLTEGGTGDRCPPAEAAEAPAA